MSTSSGTTSSWLTSSCETANRTHHGGDDVCLTALGLHQHDGREGGYANIGDNGTVSFPEHRTSHREPRTFRTEIHHCTPSQADRIVQFVSCFLELLRWALRCCFRIGNHLKKKMLAYINDEALLEVPSCMEKRICGEMFC